MLKLWFLSKYNITSCILRVFDPSSQSQTNTQTSDSEAQQSDPLCTLLSLT